MKDIIIRIVWLPIKWVLYTIINALVKSGFKD